MRLLPLLLACLLATAPAWAQTRPVTVGVILSLSGPGASIGIPYSKGIAAYMAGPGGANLKLIQLDDTSDPAAAARAARKLIEEEHVDVLIGSTVAPTSLAIYGVAAEAATPLIISANATVPGERGQWEITIPQPFPLMVSADIGRMKSAGIRTLAFIGFNDAFGDVVYDAVAQTAAAADIKIVANERYARTDTSVTPQILKILASHPDAVITGGSGSQGALPHLALAERGYRGAIYSTHAVINAEFVRVGGASVEGLIAPTGPVVVAEQLDDANPIKAVALNFRTLYRKANNADSTDAFAAYTYDAMLVLQSAIARVSLPPGTPEYRAALRAALATGQNVVGSHAVYNFSEGHRYGTDERSRVLVRLDHGSWKLIN